ncbi:MAG: hypothetical protein QF578_15030 [Alphaproteobacteria bacterium]|jgi:hypothetical protein|nr:hypothetical protein [Alphaproteobacteria bacterium]MDP6566139.1 hypothetical protein [Alphaproteobacteria bacterium]MDP6815222.1 hypothetical protein [Alphaproteobacteria bacterium]
MQRIFTAVIAATFLGLAGAAVAANITGDHRKAFYEPILVNYVIADGNLPTVVVGQPFGAGGNAAMLGSIKLSGDFPTTPLTPTTVQARDGGHLVFVFGPPITAHGRHACEAPSKLARPAGGGNLRLLAAFCYGDEVVSEAYMEMAKPSGPATGEFQQAMGQLLAVLLPPYNPDGGCTNTTIVC